MYMHEHISIYIYAYTADIFVYI